MAEKKTKKQEKKVEKKETKTEENTMTGLSFKGEIVLVYVISILGLIFSLIKGKDIPERLKFHYNQSGTIFIISFISNIVFNVTEKIIIISSEISDIISILLVVFSVVAVIKLCKDDEDYEIPLVSELSKSIFIK